MLLEISGEITPERMNEGMEPKQKQYPVMDVAGDRSKVRCYKQQYCQRLVDCIYVSLFWGSLFFSIDLSVLSPIPHFLIIIVAL